MTEAMMKGFTWSKHFEVILSQKTSNKTAFLNIVIRVKTNLETN
jgi:hypothetical protein